MTLATEAFHKQILTEYRVPYGHGVFRLQHYRYSASVPPEKCWRVDITEPNRGCTLSRRGKDPSIIIELLMQDFEDRGMV